MSWRLLQNSLLVSGLTMTLAVSLGFVTALTLASAETRWRRIMLWLTIAALALPPFVVTNCWLDLLGGQSLLRHWLPLDLYSLGGAVWLLTLLTWPISTLFVLGAWSRVEPSQLESDPALRGGSLIRWLLWPMARGAASQAAVVVFVLALNNFAVPVILQVPVFPEELWLAFTTRLGEAGAWTAAWPLVAAPVALLFLLKQSEISWPRMEGSASARAIRRQLGRRWVVCCGGATVLLLLVSVGLPLGQLTLSARTWAELPNLFRAAPDVIGNSFAFAAFAATACVAVGLLIWRLSFGWILWLPFLIPGVLLARTMIFVFGGSIIYGTVVVVFLAFTIRYLAFGWNGAALALRSLDRDLTDAARLDGARGWILLRHVHWPQIAPQIAGAWYVTYLLCLWDVETLVLIYPPGGETLALRIFNLLHYGHHAQVNALCLALLGLALVPLFAWEAIRWIHTNMWKLGIGTTITVTGTLLSGCMPKSSVTEASLDNRLFSHAEVVGARGTALGQFNKPRSVTVDRDDNLYVVDMTGRVQKFSPRGEFLLSWQLPQTDLGKPKGMCTDTNGNIIVVEPHYQRVNHFTPHGALVEQWGRRGTNVGEFVLPRAVAVNSRGDVFISEYTLVDRAQGFSAADRKPLVCFGTPGNGQGEFNRAEGLGIGPDDRIYVADSCNHRVQVFSNEGQWLRSYGKPGRGRGEFSYPYDVQVDREGRQYVCEFGNSRLQAFDTNDQPIEIIGGPGNKPGQFNNPWSIALDSRGNLYVADSGNHRVQKLVRRP